MLSHTHTHTHTHTQPAEEHHKLFCFYYTGRNNPRLILKPAKMEVVFPDPKLYMWRDALSEPEMSRLKQLAEPKVCVWVCMCVYSYVYKHRRASLYICMYAHVYMCVFILYNLWNGSVKVYTLKKHRCTTELL